MSKRWTKQEDEFLFHHFDAVGDYIGPHDLGRPKGAAAKRAKHLKACGAWDALQRANDAGRDYRRCLGLPCAEDKVFADAITGRVLSKEEVEARVRAHREGIAA